MARILIVEDEKALASGLKDNFEFEGYDIEMVYDGESAIETTLSFQPHLIILDVMLPKKSGFDVCRELRSKKVETPIIMLTARGEEIDKVLGLEFGADDYMTKPFSVRELLARVKAVLRRYPAEAADRLSVHQIGRLQFDTEHLTAKDENGDVELTHREIEILKYFLLHEGDIISRDNLLDEVWGYENYPTSRTVDNYIVKLRKKIEDDPEHPRHILTVYGIGYKFIK